MLWDYSGGCYCYCGGSYDSIVEVKRWWHSSSFLSARSRGLDDAISLIGQAQESPMQNAEFIDFDSY